MKKKTLLFGIGLMMVMLLGTYKTSAQGFIEVYPVDFDYGDVIVGNEASTIVTAQNIGDVVAVLWEIVLTDNSGMFEIRSALYPPIELAPMGEDGDAQDIEVAFVPKAAGYFEATVYIDTYESSGVANLSGMGVDDTPPIDLTIGDLIDFFDQGIEAGTIQGTGPKPKVRDNREKNFRKILVKAQQAYDDGKIAKACDILNQADLKSNGEMAPPDWIQGPAVEELNTMIEEVLGLLGCEEGLIPVEERAGQADNQVLSVLDKHIQVYPNPAGDRITIQYEVEEESPILIQLFYQDGQRISTLMNSKQDSGTHSISYDTNKLSTGLYVITYHVNSQVYHFRFEKIK